MDNEVFNRLKAFIIRQYSFFESREIVRWTRVEENLGIYGDEAVDFLLAYSKEFNVDVSNFMAADYFSPEGIGRDIIGDLKASLFSKKYPYKPKKELTISDLEKGILMGALNEEVIASKNPFMEAEFVREIKRLPEVVQEKVVRSGNEFGWRQADFEEAIMAARNVPMAIIGGQICYALPDGTCELYWLSYDPKPRKENEKWIPYCNRTVGECITKFKDLNEGAGLEMEAKNFDFLQQKMQSGVDIGPYRLFMVLFDDSESDNFKIQS